MKTAELCLKASIPHRSEIIQMLLDLTVEDPVQGDSEVPVDGPTIGPGECRLTCPHNAMENGYELMSQPCVYVLRVQEVFKGNYSVSSCIIFIYAVASEPAGNCTLLPQPSEPISSV